MISGYVTASTGGAGLDAVVTLSLRGPGGLEATVELAIDTGFHGHIGLPLDLIDQRKMPYHSSFDAVLADGRATRLEWVVQRRLSEPNLCY